MYLKDNKNLNFKNEFMNIYHLFELKFPNKSECKIVISFCSSGKKESSPH